jgi:outer membrane protein assembly factor BamB
MRRLLPLFGVIGLVGLNLGGNWPQFRGENGSGITTEKNLPTSWSGSEGYLWKMEIPGRGVSCPVVWEDRIYITSASGVRSDRLHVLCYSLKDGSMLWQRQLSATGNTGCHPTSSMAAPTPVATKDGVYALFATGDMAAFDKEGNLKWYRSLVADYPTVGNQVGMASSPILWKDYLLVPMDNSGDSFLAAIDVQYGRNVWKVERHRDSNWVTPALRTVKGKTEVLFQNRLDLTAYDPGTGKELWKYVTDSGSIATPVTVGEKIIVPARGVHLIDVEGEKITPVWKSAALGGSPTSPLVFGDRVYNLSSAGVVKCANLSDGKVIWEARGKGKYWASPLIGDGKIYIFNETGLTTVWKLGDEPEEVATNDLGEEILGTPAIAEGSFIIRTGKYLYRIGEKRAQ